MALYMLKMGGAGKDRVSSPPVVIPAKAGIQQRTGRCAEKDWTPFAGVTAERDGVTQEGEETSCP